MNSFFDWHAHVGSQTDKFFKTTLWQAEHVMLVLNCLETQQVQSVHAHQGADKFYFVLEGSGQFTVAEEEQEASAGSIIVAPSGIPHGVKNIGTQRLSLLVAIAPGIK